MADVATLVAAVKPSVVLITTIHDGAGAQREPPIGGFPGQRRGERGERGGPAVNVSAVSAVSEGGPGERGDRGGQGERGERGEAPGWPGGRRGQPRWSRSARGGRRERGMQHTEFGSGILTDADGHVVTNAHVVEGSEHVRVRLADDREFDAKVIGRDKLLDLAVL